VGKEKDQRDEGNGSERKVPNGPPTAIKELTTRRERLHKVPGSPEARARAGTMGRKKTSRQLNDRRLLKDQLHFTNVEKTGGSSGAKRQYPAGRQDPNQKD